MDRSDDAGQAALRGKVASFVQQRLPAVYRARAEGEGDEPEIEGFFARYADRVNDDRRCSSRRAVVLPRG